METYYILFIGASYLMVYQGRKLALTREQKKSIRSAHKSAKYKGIHQNKKT